MPEAMPNYRQLENGLIQYGSRQWGSIHPLD